MQFGFITKAAYETVAGHTSYTFSNLIARLTFTDTSTCSTDVSTIFRTALASSVPCSGRQTFTLLHTTRWNDEDR